MELPENVDILPSVLREALRAIRWYARRSPRTANRFVDMLGEVFSKISEGPLRWPQYSNRTRFIRLQRFPYVVYFEIRGSEAMIVAVVHTSRRPQYWRWRLK